ncbi:putative NEDD8 activating enzyme [Hortaea werneckii]|uniref:NEDD8-activating enzyme E1 catalytic subunit n=1 Tax=Hortaea werneckii TaxID=91943 RepID=A0A3M7F956_HORWE|nr:putative NEDD8 activating enzyme [Hortaea werneckii]KAI6878985.1 putative NEDD8 activating enzyme [Hortaea werneckii]KAI6986892.1 putative NEDD8 activating enzyme [Hortaea werneckii]KAI7086262.1 putative NEDD8 activating enzyme [Hortaea werneckii]KAI7141139.1 putative NEDD8 activating enzyme [Hortaea werneckii]
MAATLQPEAVAADLNGGPATPLTNKWKYVNTLLSRDGPYASEEFEAGETPLHNIANSRVLVIGAGGLGCEILKNLALSGFKNVDVIDMDTIDVSNLNRQFLFREKDVGRPKAEVAAEFVMRRVPGCTITPYVGKIQDKDEAYYLQFQAIICGLDSIEARRWINSTLVAMVDMENPDSLKPLIDGGTEGFKGQSRVIWPTMTSCIECQLDMHAPRAAVPLCTLATIPRQPQHCIEWAHIIKWEEERKGIPLDTDDPEHITWLYRTAAARAAEFNITGVTYAMTQGVVKNIIPAIASTNAIIAASCCNEAFKIITQSASFLANPTAEDEAGRANYMLYTGDAGIYTYTFEHQKKDDCPVCGNLPKDMSLNPEQSLGELVESLAERPESQLKKPNLRTEEKTLYYSTPAGLEEATRSNLKRKLNELLADGEEFAVSDPAFDITFRYVARFS